jgi:tape measure domain-containing protein
MAMNLDAVLRIAARVTGLDALASLQKGILGATGGAGGLGQAVIGLAARFGVAATAAEVLRQGITASFERGAAEQRLKNLTSSAGEYDAAIAAAAASSAKFNVSQTEATTALADAYGRLKGVGFGLKETTQIYEGFNVVAKQSGLAAEDAAGVFFQLSQALGKGKLNGDEFVSVGERMPGLLDLIAEQSGVTRGQLQQMSESGKITSEVLYKALAKAAQGSGDLNAKLTDQQRAMGGLARVADQLKVQIGNVFSPAIVVGAQLLEKIGSKLSEWFGYLGQVIFPKLYTALKPVIDEFQKIWEVIPWDTILGYLQDSIIRALNGIVTAIRLIAPITAFIIGKFRELATNPVFRFLAEQVGVLLSKIGITNNKVDEFTEKQDKARGKVQGTLDAYSSMPPKIEEASQKTKGLADAANAVLLNAQAQERSIQSQINALERGSSVTAARFAAEKELATLKGQQLEIEYQSARNSQQRYEIAVKMFYQQKQIATLEYNQAVGNIQLEQQKGQLQLQSAQNKLNEIAAEGKLQVLKAEGAEQEKQKNQKMQEALAAQQLVVDAAKSQTESSKEIAKYQEVVAGAQYRGKILSAETAFQQKLVSAEIGLSQSRAEELSKYLHNSYSSSVELGAATKTVATNAANSAQMFIRVATEAESAATAIKNAADQQARLNSLRGQRSVVQSQPSGAAAGGGIPKFAQGGVVDRPTVAMVGEGGEREYIVPESKMRAASSSYLAGARGGAVLAGAAPSGGGAPTINITTGPVVEFDGQRYVTLADMERAMRLTAEGVIGRLRTPSARIALGIA